MTNFRILHGNTESNHTTPQDDDSYFGSGGIGASLEYSSYGILATMVFAGAYYFVYKPCEIPQITTEIPPS